MLTGITFETLENWNENFDIMKSFLDSYYINPTTNKPNPRNKSLDVLEIETELLEKVGKKILL